MFFKIDHFLIRFGLYVILNSHLKWHCHSALASLSSFIFSKDGEEDYLEKQGDSIVVS